MPVENLRDLLDEVGQSRSPRGLIAYPLGNTETSRTMTYRDLRETAIHNSLVLRAIEGFSQGSVILLHFNEHLDNITWFWSVLYAGCIPALSTPFTNNASQRDKHIKHLHTLLGDPMCLTRSASLSDFPTQPILKVLTIESLGEGPASSETGEFQLSTIHPGDTAALMLTSGSTGDSKAVCLSHEQVLSAIKGKASIRPVGGGFSCLNWTGIDHVAGLVEIHLLALHFNVDQIHVQAPDLIANPRKFLSLIDKHRVARSFAPNFFLAKLRREIKTQTLNGYTASNGHAVPNGHKVSNGNAFSNGHSNGIAHPNGSATPKYGHSDLSCLRFIASGGEANPIETCIAVSELLMEYGTPRNVIVPGFGMTETCAGSIYNTESMDHVNGLDFASVGTCVPGIKMRITTQSETPRIAEIGETGDLEVSGKIVFKEYFNNPSATKAAFTHDGWFKTGDRALIDSAGKLNLVGRSKETMTINGIKYVPHEIETALEEALIPGVASSYIVCFSFRPRGQKSETEQICIVYLPTFAADDDEARVRASDAIVKTVMIQTSIRPQVLPLEISLLHKTTLGKLSRTKIRTAFEKGEYKDYENYNASVLAAYRAAHFEGPKNELEALLLQEFEETLELEGQHSLGVDTPVFEMGITSIDLIKASHRIEQRLNSPMKIPIIMIMTNPTVRSLASAIHAHTQRSPDAYDPVVVLQQSGPKLPLWLFHPGVGEVLVFLGLAKFLTDRPVYAFRARGFEPGQAYFENIDEAVAIYHTAIKERQSIGPYAMAGYSYGSMLAFETAKVLEKNGDEVRFLGVFNLPPHIKFRMRQLDWKECLLNLAYFLDLITEQRAHELSSETASFSREKALEHVMGIANPERVKELSLTHESISTWAGLAFSLQRMAVDYDPSGEVMCMDVFYCTPLAMVAQSRPEWLDNYLKPWNGFCRTEPRFHEVGGSHYTMIGAHHVLSFQKKLKQVLKERNV